MDVRVEPKEMAQPPNGRASGEMGERHSSRGDLTSKPPRMRRWMAAILVMVLMIGALTAIQASRADVAKAAVCYSNISLTKSSGGGTLWMKLKASGMCGTVRGPGARFTANPTWTRTYGENPVYRFNKWFPNASATGIGMAPNGDSNVAYVARWSAVEFISCFPPVPCIHSFPHGVRLWIWANGQWQGAQTTVVPYTPMPRP